MKKCKNINCQSYSYKTKSNCKMFSDITNCRKAILEDGWIPVPPVPPKNLGKLFNVTFQLYKIPPQLSSYTFRGPVNFTILTSDCFRQKLPAFLLIQDNSAIYGISRQAPVSFIQKLQSLTNSSRLSDTYYPYHLFICQRQEIHGLLKLLPDTKKEIRKHIKRFSKELKKSRDAGKFSNKPETAVKLFT